MEEIQAGTEILPSRPDEVQYPKVRTENKVGRPSTVTPEVLLKLEQVFALDGTVEEALSYAEIKKDAYYRYLEANPEFRERINDLRQRPILKARQTVIKSLDDPNQAFKYLEKKAKKEFGNTLDVDLTVQSKIIKLDE